MLCFNITLQKPSDSDGFCIWLLLSAGYAIFGVDLARFDAPRALTPCTRWPGLVGLELLSVKASKAPCLLTSKAS